MIKAELDVVTGRHDDVVIDRLDELNDDGSVG
jgi:hypothetical protein